ncbi:hypothetical protein DXG01_004476 [Tephrocybe rancida]|nr:hypothetical protein DXG01_004476 [Tephrocybe rancida]
MPGVHDLQQTLGFIYPTRARRKGTKSCHVKNFGTRDLRQANLPHHEITPETDGPRSTSPLRTTLITTPPRLASPLRNYGSNGNSFDPPSIAPRRTALSTSPIASSFPPDTSESEDTPEPTEPQDSETNDDVLNTPPRHSTPALVSTPSNTGRPGLGGIPRTVPLTPTRSGTYGAYSSSARARPFVSNSVGGTPSQASTDDIFNATPILQTTTGTRYGAALTSNLTGVAGSPKRWGASTNPTCPRCGKSVYFAEQVKAVGKTFHKNCLRCTECNTSLDSSRLRDHDGEPLCVRCYGKAS